MKAIYLAFIIIIFGFATNKEQYNNITKDTFSQKYYNLSELNNYFFVFPAKLNELTHIVLRTYYLSRNVFQYININEYKTYTSNYTEIVKKTTPNYQYMNIIINNETYTNFSVTTQNSGVKYIGIEFAPTIDLEFLIVTIVSKYKFELSYDQIDKRNLYAYIPYVYSFDVYNNFMEELNYSIVCNYIENGPFKKFNIYEYYLDNSRSLKVSSNANFKVYNNASRLSYLYKISDSINVKYGTFEFVPDYDLTDFKIKINGSHEIMNKEYFKVEKDNFNKKYEYLKKNTIYNIFFNASKNDNIYTSIRTKYNPNNNIFKSLNIYDCIINKDSSIIFSNIMGYIPLQYKNVNDESIIDYQLQLNKMNFTKDYVLIEIKLNNDIDYLTISLVANNQIDLEYNKVNTRTLFPGIPYIYNFDTSKITDDNLNIFISTEYTSNIPFKTFNITEYLKNYPYSNSKAISTNFKKNNNIYEFSFTYKIEKSSIYTKNISFDFISEYELKDFTIIVNNTSEEEPPEGPETELYEVNNNDFNKTYFNLKKEKIYYFVFPSEINKNIYFSIRTNYISGNIFDDITIYNVFSYNSKIINGVEYKKIETNYMKIDDESCLSFDALLLENFKYSGLGLKLNYDLKYLSLTIVSNNNIHLKYNKLSTKLLFPLIPYYFWIDISTNSKKEVNFTASTQYISKTPFNTFNITEHSSETSDDNPKTIITANFVKNNNLYVLSDTYKAQYQSTKYISFDFISNYELQNFNIKVEGGNDDEEEEEDEDEGHSDDSGNIFYNVNNTNYNKKILNLKKEKTYFFVLQTELSKNFYCAIRTKYIDDKIFKGIYSYNYEIYDINTRDGYLVGLVDYKYKKINNEFAINFKTCLKYERTKYLAIELKLNYDLDYLVFTMIPESTNNINLKYNKLNSMNIYPFIPYFYYIDITKKPNDLKNITITTKYTSNIPFTTYNITEHISENSFLTPKVYQADFVRKNDMNELFISYKVLYFPHSKYISVGFISDYELQNFNIKVDGPDDDEDNTDETKILGLSVAVFSLIVGGAVIVIVAIVIIIILRIKKRRKNNYEEQVTQSYDQPLFPIS